MKKISILYENMQSMKPDDYYRDIIVGPAVRKVIITILTRRREYGTYLATARRHRRRLKMQKRDE